MSSLRGLIYNALIWQNICSIFHNLLTFPCSKAQYDTFCDVTAGAQPSRVWWSHYSASKNMAAAAFFIIFTVAVVTVSASIKIPFSLTIELTAAPFLRVSLWDYNNKPQSSNKLYFLNLIFIHTHNLVAKAAHSNDQILNFCSGQCSGWRIKWVIVTCGLSPKKFANFL